jgi:hypothetical protein
MKIIYRVIIVALLFLPASGCGPVYVSPSGNSVAKIKLVSECHGGFTSVDGKWLDPLTSNTHKMVTTSPGHHTLEVMNSSYYGCGNAVWKKEVDIPSPGNYILNVKVVKRDSGTTFYEAQLEKVD